MRDAQVILWCLFQLFLFLVLVKLLAKVKLLPLMVYLCGVATLFPAWRAEQPFAYYGIAALLLLYPIAYWGLRFYRHRQEERAMLGELLARAKPLYGSCWYYSQTPVPQWEEELEPGTEEYEDYWYDR